MVAAAAMHSRRVTPLPTVVSILSNIFILLCLVHLWRKRKSSLKVRDSRLRWIKLVLSPLLPCVCLSQWIISRWRNPSPGIAESWYWISQCLAAFFASVLSNIEHRYSICPSTLVTVYLLLTSSYDLICAASFQVPLEPFITSLPLLQLEVLLRLALLFFESQGKEGILVPKHLNEFSPGDTAGIMKSALFWWVNDIMAQGRRSILELEDMPRLDKAMNPERLRASILKHWEDRKIPEGKMTLVWVLLRSSATPFISSIPLRVMLAIFRGSQPILIHETIKYVTDERLEDNSTRRGYVLLGAAVVIYFGLAISSSQYRHSLNRLSIYVKGSLSTLLYEKSLGIDGHSSDAGRALTLLTTDTNEVVESGEMFHETWGNLLELIIGLIILASQVRWLWPLPLFIIFFESPPTSAAVCSRVSRYVAQNIQPKQKAWNSATQARIGALSQLLGSMKSVKSMGLSSAMAGYVEDLRRVEIEKSKALRMVMVIYNASANALGIFTPVLTIVVYALVSHANGSELDVATAFTAVATLAIVTHPANMVMTMVPRAFAVFASFERIQEYLTTGRQEDGRMVLPRSNVTPSLLDLAPDVTSLAVVAENVRVKALPEDKQDILRGINLSLEKGSINILCGAVGTGKSAFARAILGEISLSGGSIKVTSDTTGYCDQNPWLPNVAIRSVICGPRMDNMDEEKYKNVMRACCLDADIESLLNKDKTLVGNRGMNLSGGQKQRLALARALYSGEDLVILDDPFSALDGTTESTIVQNLLSQNGWFRERKITAIVITNSAQYFNLADRVILFGGGEVLAQGPPGELKQSLREIAKVSVRENESEARMRNDTAETSKALAQDLAKKEAKADLYRKTAHYLKTAGVWNVGTFVACTAVYSVCISILPYWIKLWTAKDPLHSSSFYIGGYSIIAFTAWVSTSCAMWGTYIRLAPSSGISLHRSLLKTVFSAPLGFFSFQDAGSIINKFGQDIGIVDRQLPMAFSALSPQIFKLLMQCILLLQAQKMLVVVFPICAIVVYLIQKLYLSTARQLRVLELESQSALYSSFIETIEGIVTIRAFRWQETLEQKNLKYLDKSLRPLYTLQCLQRWLSLILDLVVGTIAILVIYLAMFWSDTSSAGSLGVSLNLILVTNTTLVRMITSWTSLEISLGAISRLKSLDSNTPNEDQPSKRTIPSPGWPSKGHLKLTNASFGYSDQEPVLRKLNLDIPPGQRTIICGRTGSGKSTLLSGLLRLIVTDGLIEVDGCDISNIPRSVLRQCCFITIPQDAMFLPGASLRFNMDPNLFISDDDIKGALMKVGLWQFFFSSHTDDLEDEILQKPLKELPQLSYGQRQLLAVARALIQKEVIQAALNQPFTDYSMGDKSHPILILDEATSSLDPETERRVLELVDYEFSQNGHSVIIVAHRSSAITGGSRKYPTKAYMIQEGCFEDITGK